jgi:hypothetical protein
MKNKITKFGIIFLVSFILLIILQPIIAHIENSQDLKHNSNYFKSIKHPKGTSEFYYNAYFGNSSGTSNHCEHVITQFRKYKIGCENEIKKYYELNYKYVTLDFYRTLEDCDGDSEFGYTAYTTAFLPDKPKFKLENANSNLPFYVIEFSINASNTLDWECY